MDERRGALLVCLLLLFQLKVHGKELPGPGGGGVVVWWEKEWRRERKLERKLR